MDFIEEAGSYDDLSHDCNEYLRLCIRKIGTKGNTSHVYQCTLCGYQVGNAIPKSSTLLPTHYFDADLTDRYIEKRAALLKSATSENTYQVTPLLTKEAFEEKLENLFTELQESTGLSRQMLDSHLQRYVMRKREQQKALFNSPFASEIELQNWLFKELSRWFYIYREVSGVGYINREKRNIRLDFIIKAKPELIAKGFTDKGIGIEVKYLNPASSDGFHKRSARGIFQALSYWYSGARWCIENNANVEISAVLIFSNLSFTGDREKLFNTIDEHYRKYWYAYLGVANHGNVGELIFDGTSSNYFKWRMNFSHATYFTGYRNGDLNMGNKNLIDKIRIGSTNE